MANNNYKNSKFKNNEDRIKYLDEKHEEIKKNQEDDLVLDFDKALEEEKAKSSKIIIKLMGCEFKLPKKMPFNFSTFFLRNCYKKIEGQWVIVMPEDKVLEYIELMFGKDFINKLEQKNNDISIDFIFKNVVPGIMKQWGYDVDTSKNKYLQKKMMNRG